VWDGDPLRAAVPDSGLRPAAPACARGDPRPPSTRADLQRCPRTGVGGAPDARDPFAGDVDDRPDRVPRQGGSTGNAYPPPRSPSGRPTRAAAVRGQRGTPSDTSGYVALAMSRWIHPARRPGKDEVLAAANESAPGPPPGRAAASKPTDPARPVFPRPSVNYVLRQGCQTAPETGQRISSRIGWDPVESQRRPLAGSVGPCRIGSAASPRTRILLRHGRLAGSSRSVIAERWGRSIGKISTSSMRANAAPRQ
jgi:hypothetical protein